MIFVMNASHNMKVLLTVNHDIQILLILIVRSQHCQFLYQRFSVLLQ